MFARGVSDDDHCPASVGDQSPLYFLALHVARNLRKSPFTIQLLNAMLLTLTLVSTYALGRASFGSPAALGAVFLRLSRPRASGSCATSACTPPGAPLGYLPALRAALPRAPSGTRSGRARASLRLERVQPLQLGFFITAILFLALLVDAGTRSFAGSARAGAREAATVRPGNARPPWPSSSWSCPSWSGSPASRRGLAASPRPVAARSLAGLPRTRELVLVHEFRLGKPARQFAPR